MLALPKIVALATALSTLASATPISTHTPAEALAGAGSPAAVAPLLSHAVDQGKEAVKDSYSQSLFAARS